MKDSRYKQLMAQVGMPQSHSLKMALEQAVNETQQACKAEAREATNEEVLKVLDEFESKWRALDKTAISLTELIATLRKQYEDK